MTILVTGATGTIGGLVLDRLAGQADVRALIRDPAKAELPDGVTAVTGDLADPAAVRAALAGVDTLFLLNAVVPDELTQALVTLDLARAAGIRRLVYFSVFNAARFIEVPHFTGKRVVEQVIDRDALPATILRPAYFFQNDLMFADALRGGVYPQPIGGTGVAMVDARDIADVAAAELLRRERAPAPLPRTTIELVGPDTLTGADLAALWTEVLGRNVRYGGDDLDAFERRAAEAMPGWQAHDMRLMLRAFHSEGMLPGDDARAVLEGLLGRPPRRYRDFAAEAAAGW